MTREDGQPLNGDVFMSVNRLPQISDVFKKIYHRIVVWSPGSMKKCNLSRETELTISMGCSAKGELPRYTPMLHEPSLSAWQPATGPRLKICLYGENTNQAKNIPTNEKKRMDQK